MKIVYINGCYDCPYAVWSLTEEDHVCSILYNDDDVPTEQSILTDEMLAAKEAPEMCPLDDSC